MWRRVLGLVAAVHQQQQLVPEEVRILLQVGGRALVTGVRGGSTHAQHSNAGKDGVELVPAKLHLDADALASGHTWRRRDVHEGDALVVCERAHGPRKLQRRGLVTRCPSHATERLLLLLHRD